MNKKIICISIIGMFLLTSISSFSAISETTENQTKTNDLNIESIDTSENKVNKIQNRQKILSKLSSIFGGVTGTIDFNYGTILGPYYGVRGDIKRPWPFYPYKNLNVEIKAEGRVYKTNNVNNHRQISRYDNISISFIWKYIPLFYDTFNKDCEYQHISADYLAVWASIYVDGEVIDTNTLILDNSWTDPPNKPPDKPTQPSGPTSGKTKIEQTYTTYTTDPNKDLVLYQFDWGDGADSDWLGPYEPGEIIEAKHTWESQGIYDIKVKAMDPLDGVSEWSKALTVNIAKKNRQETSTMPYNFPLLERLLLNLQ